MQSEMLKVAMTTHRKYFGRTVVAKKWRPSENTRYLYYEHIS